MVTDKGDTPYDMRLKVVKPYNAWSRRLMTLPVQLVFGAQV